MSDERTTIEDVAKRAGVSIATVSRVLNQTGYVAANTRERVQVAIKELNFHPNAAARGLAARRTHTIGLAIHEIRGDFFQPMLSGIESTASSYGFDLLIHTTRHAVAKLTSVGDHNTDGLLVFADSLSERELMNFHITGFPVILLHRSSPPGLNIPCVTIENKSGARRMVDHLIENCGRRRIAYLSGPPNQEDSYWREIGYRESLAAHNINFTLVGTGEFSVEPSRITVARWLQNNLELDAIFAADDEAAIGAMLAINEVGLRIPEDIAVVGFDDMRLSQYLTPSLSTVRAPTEAVAIEAVHQLMRLITTGQAEPLTLLPTELVIRESCGHHLIRKVS